MNVRRPAAFAAALALTAGVLAGCGGSASDEAIADAQQAVEDASQVAKEATEQASSFAEQALEDAKELQADATAQIEQATQQAEQTAQDAQAVVEDIQAQVEQEVADATEQAEQQIADATEQIEDAVTPMEPAPSQPADVMVEEAAGPFEPGAFAAIADELVARLGYEPNVLTVTLADSYVSFDVQDKAKPENVDRYTWRSGIFEDAVPVDLFGAGSLEENLFPLASVKFDVITKLVKAGNSLDIEGAQTSTVLLGRMLPTTSDVVWLVNVEGTRDTKQLRADLKGKVFDVL